MGCEFESVEKGLTYRNIRVDHRNMSFFLSWECSKLTASFLPHPILSLLLSRIVVTEAGPSLSDFSIG
jgi:hypothetical protein